MSDPFHADPATAGAAHLVPEEDLETARRILGIVL